MNQIEIRFIHSPTQHSYNHLNLDLNQIRPVFNSLIGISYLSWPFVLGHLFQLVIDHHVKWMTRLLALSTPKERSIARIAQTTEQIEYILLICQYERDKALITRLHILSHWSQLWLKWTFGQSNNMIGTIDIRGGLTVSRWLLTEAGMIYTGHYIFC